MLNNILTFVHPAYGSNWQEKLDFHWRHINEQLPHWPSNIDLGFRAGLPLLEVKLTTTCHEGYQQKNIFASVLQQFLLIKLS